ncbi:hypothetical protein NE865_00054 [Phthorimaea operculella]|nr:hypothetical protein NE865_00054 [Phthorimaea operculella]
MRSSVLSATLCWGFIFLGLFDDYKASLLLKDSAARPKFDFFKKKYNKIYKSELDEHQAYVNFVNNWNQMDKLNEKRIDAIETYHLNSFADLSPVYIQQHYAVNLTPYDNEIGEAADAKALRESKQKADNVKLYDLDNAEELYKKFLKKFRKPTYGKTKFAWRFRKFVQTLARINRHNLLNNDKKTFDIHADELTEPKKITFS